MVYLNGAFKTNVTKGTMSYNATNLIAHTSYTIATRTVDTSGNINATWVNHTSWTAPGPDTPNTTTYTDPASPHGATRVLVYSDQNNKTAGSPGVSLNNTAVLMALRNLHYNYTATNDPAAFKTQLATHGPWTFIIWNEELNAPPGGTYDAIRTYILGGGKALVSSGKIELNRTAPLWSTLGISPFRNIIYSNGQSSMFPVTPASPHLHLAEPGRKPGPVQRIESRLSALRVQPVPLHRGQPGGCLGLRTSRIRTRSRGTSRW